MDEISPLATRELDTTLEARSIFDSLSKKKAKHSRPKSTMPPTTARVIYNVYTNLQQSHQKALDESKGKRNATYEDKGVTKAYKKLTGGKSCGASTRN